MKEHSCSDNLKQLTPNAQSSSTNDGNRKGHVPHLNDFFDEREAGEKITSGKHTSQTHEVNTLQVQKAPERK